MLSRYQKHLVVAVAYLALVLIMTVPVIFSFTTSVAGSGGDPWQTMWRFENTQALLASGGWDFIARELGAGEPRLVNLSVWPWLWLAILFGQPVAYNLVWLLSAVLSGFAMYVLVEQLTRSAHREEDTTSVLLSAAPAFLAGVFYMFLPYRIAHSQGHFGAMQTGWIPLVLLLTILLVRQPTWWRVLGLALVLTIQAWTEHHYFLWLLILGVFASWVYRDQLRAFFRERAGGWYAAALVALLFATVVLPYRPTLRLALGDDTPLALGTDQTVRFSADPFAYLTPASFHTLWGEAAQFFFGQHFTGNQFESTQFLGLVPLLLVIFFWRSIPEPQRFFWGLAVLVFAVISFGPRLHLLGRVTEIPLPYAFLADLPVFSSVRAVARAGSIVGLAWALLLAWVLRHELRRAGGALLMLCILLLEFLFLPVTVQSAVLSDVYADLPSLPGSALIELPAATNYRAASRALFASQRHGKEVLGNIALERAFTGDELDDVRSLPGLRQLLFLRTEHLLANRTDFFAQDTRETLPDVLRYLDVHEIVVHRDSLSPRQQEAVRHTLEDVFSWHPTHFGDAVRYSVRDTDRGDGIFLSRDERWIVTTDAENAESLAGITDKASLTLYNINANPRRVELRFNLDETSRGSLVIRQNDNILFDASAQPSGTFAPVSLELMPGATKLDFTNRLPDAVVLENPILVVQ